MTNTGGTATVYPTGTPYALPDPIGFPTPHDFANEIEAAQYVHDMIDPGMIWVEYYMARASRADIELMKAGPGATWPTLEPNQTPYADSPEGQAVFWIVGFKSFLPFSGDKLHRAMFLPTWPAATGGHPGGTEACVLMDDYGNIFQSEFLDAVDEAGESVHFALWELSSIEDLPAP